MSYNDWYNALSVILKSLLAPMLSILSLGEICCVLFCLYYYSLFKNYNCLKIHIFHKYHNQDKLNTQIWIRELEILNIYHTQSPNALPCIPIYPCYRLSCQKSLYLSIMSSYYGSIELFHHFSNSIWRGWRVIFQGFQFTVIIIYFPLLGLLFG